MNTKNLFYTIILIGLLWSCGKDESPEPAKNNAPKTEAQTFTVAEDISDAITIGTVKATDADQDELTFSISTNDNNLFEISNSGSLSLASGKSLDFSVKAQHQIVVSVTDGQDQKEADITIKVENVIESLAEEPDSFVTLWNIPESNFEIMVGTNMDYEYNYTIDWGDGVQENLTTQNPSHIYSQPGIYKVAIQGNFPAISMGTLNPYLQSQVINVWESLVGIEQWGSIEWKSLKYAFAFCPNLEYHAEDVPDLQNVQDLSGMFLTGNLVELDYNQQSVFNADLSNWDVSNITNMSAMFANAREFTSDLSNWDVSNVTDMSGMFGDAMSFNSDLSKWDVSKVTDMSGMFRRAEVFNSDLSDWNVSNVTNMASMFFGATSFNADLSSWKVDNVIDMSWMFTQAESFNSDISNWNVVNVTNMNSMFSNAILFNANISNWEVDNVTDMGSMFANAQSFNADIGGWNVGNVTDMQGMFAYAQSFNADIGGWDVSQVDDMTIMFLEAPKFDQDLENWNLESLKFAFGMFNNSGISPVNLSTTIIGWANNPSTSTDVPFGIDGLSICDTNESLDAYTKLKENLQWEVANDPNFVACQ
ncbi:MULTISPECIES: BspA family leucine-rich repeat surface protein [unclassified Flagellimonas]|uniref:BspA family leucine-rich repeat surface protein n=1 Tax=Flagellimonas sp. MMG031 TaxID=3158549 RepID=A0AAU7MVJ7_9FLAO